MGTKKSKAAVAASDRVATSINKVLTDVSANSSMRRAQNDKRWDVLMQKTDMKLELTKSKVVMMKRKEDFMILPTDMSNMNPQVKEAHDMFCAAILQELGFPRHHPQQHRWRLVTPTPMTADTHAQDDTHYDIDDE